MKKVIIFIFFIFFSSSIFLPQTAKGYDPLSRENNIFGIGIVNHSDLYDASKMINSSGGDWGYVTIVITEKERDKAIWQKFFDDARRLHLIPIIRVATSFDGQNWTEPSIEEIDKWINFFNSLNWVVENRYIIIANEPNHSKEWGGKIDPEAYAVYLKEFAVRLNNANNDYFVLNAGFDQAAPNGLKTMDEKLYIQRMVKKVPDVFEFIDGWNSHSYPNPGFNGSEYASGRKSIRGYEWELSVIKSFNFRKDYPIFITETGWARNIRNSNLIAKKMEYSFKEVWMKNKKIVAVTPFVLNYQSEPFYEFSWKDENNTFFDLYYSVSSISKIKGNPIQKIDGEIVFKFLNPLIRSNTSKNGFMIVKNTGQNIWDRNNVKVTVDNNSDAKIEDIKINDLPPFSTGLLIYTLKIPELNNVTEYKIGLYVNDSKIDEVSTGKIIPLP